METLSVRGFENLKRHFFPSPLPLDAMGLVAYIIAPAMSTRALNLSQRARVYKEHGHGCTDTVRKIWNDHVVRAEPDGTTLLYIDRHLVHEVTSPQAFEGLTVAGRTARRSAAALAVPDHNVRRPTAASPLPIR